MIGEMSAWDWGVLALSAATILSAFAAMLALVVELLGAWPADDEHPDSHR